MMTHRWMFPVAGPLGRLAVEVRDGRLWSVAPPGEGESLSALPAAASGAAVSADRELRGWFGGTVRGFEALELADRGTVFQREVWAAARTIPRGETLSYGELARRIGRPRAARAVGAALGANPWLVVVPCHRVVGSDGSLTGFACGREAKRWLLDHEADGLWPPKAVDHGASRLRADG